MVLAALAALAAALLCPVAGCDRAAPETGPEIGSETGPKTGSKTGDGVSIVCTVGMVTDIVREVAGDRAEVVGLVRSGVDPHMHAPTRSDLARLRDADLVFLNGLRLEGRMTDALDRIAAAGTPVVAIAEGIAPADRLSAGGSADAWDPHVWMDPILWAQAVEVVRDALVAHDRDGAEIYRTNAAAYLAELEALAADADALLASVPESRRVLITSHDAFNYFGRRHDFEVLGIQGISTESEAGVRRIEALVDLLVERRIPAVFVESTVGTRHVEALLAGAKARGHEVVVGGELFSDAMGDEGTYEGTYLGMIDHNVVTIARALGGEAPEGGLRGRLGGTGTSPETTTP